MLWVPFSLSHAAVDVLPTQSESEAVSHLRDELNTRLAGAPPGNAALRVTIGPQAFREALAADGATPLIATFLTSVEFNQILGSRPRPSHISAVFSNPDPVDQLQLARAIYGASRIGAYASPNAQPLVTRLINDPDFVSIEANADTKTAELIRRARGTDVLLVLPDAEIINRGNVNQLIRSFYRQRRVLIGYSQTLTRIGSLASVYPTRNAMLDTTQSMVSDFGTEGRLPPPTYVDDIAVSINERLARSLNIVLPAPDSLADQIKAERDP